MAEENLVDPHENETVGKVLPHINVEQLTVSTQTVPVLEAVRKHARGTAPS